MESLSTSPFKKRVNRGRAPMNAITNDEFEIAAENTTSKHSGGSRVIAGLRREQISVFNQMPNSLSPTPPPRLYSSGARGTRVVATLRLLGIRDTLYPRISTPSIYAHKFVREVTRNNYNYYFTTTRAVPGCDGGSRGAGKSFTPKTRYSRKPAFETLLRAEPSSRTVRRPFSIFFYFSRCFVH